MEFNIRVFQKDDEQEVIQLWKRCGLVVPHNDPEADIARKLNVQPELFLVGVRAGRVVATVMAGYEGHRGCINYLAVSPEFQRQGLARRMMETVEGMLLKMGCPKINLQVRETNFGVVEFYKRLGFKDDHVVSLGKKL
jgi:ribosomal protein S18 acetylase RimI-like enzyme